jgi:dipeptidase E
MKLFLTSTGLSSPKIIEGFLKILNGVPEKTCALVIAYGQNEIEEFYIEESKKQVQNLGINTTSLNMQDSFEINELPNFDVMYVCGGNTFSILNKMREVRIDEFIKSEVARGAIYVGVSAGSIIAGPSIEIAGWGTGGDENEIGLEDLIGFGFTNIAVSPHFDIYSQKEEIEEFKKKVNYTVQELTDEQALVILDSDKYIIN